MNLLERIKELCKKRSISVSRLEEILEFPSNTIYQWKNRTPGTEKLSLVADYFGVTIDYLLGRTDTPQFTAKNERDVQKMLSEMKDGLTNKHTLAYFKNEGEEIDEEDAELLAEALEFVVRQSKLIAKKKYTRKDYRKENHDDLA